MSHDSKRQITPAGSTWFAKEATDFKPTKKWHRKKPQQKGEVDIKVENKVSGPKITVQCINFPGGTYGSAFHGKEFKNVKWIAPVDKKESGYLEFVFKNYGGNSKDYTYRIEPYESLSKKRAIRCKAVNRLPEQWLAEEGG